MTRILVVDDAMALVELVRSYLEREQYEVLTAVVGALNLIWHALLSPTSSSSTLCFPSLTA